MRNDYAQMKVYRDCDGITFSQTSQTLNAHNYPSLGNQTPIRPEGVVETYADHRLWMTAACISSKVGAILSHPKSYEVSDPDFLSRILEE